MEQLGDLAPVLVDRRGDDMRGRLLCELDDELTEIGLDHLDTQLFQVMIEFSLFRDHRFTLDHRSGAGGLQDIADDRVGLLGCLGPMHLDAVRGQPGFELFKQFGLPYQCIGAHHARLFTQ